MEEYQSYFDTETEFDRFLWYCKMGVLLLLAFLCIVLLIKLRMGVV